jgi:circadian clock protein KaiB
MRKLPALRCELYVAGLAPNSLLAVANLGEFCRRHFPDRHEIEVFDVYRHPARALAETILMTPTLILRAPLPERRIVGTLADTQVLLNTLGLGSRGS